MTSLPGHPPTSGPYIRVGRASRPRAESPSPSSNATIDSRTRWALICIHGRLAGVVIRAVPATSSLRRA